MAEVLTDQRCAICGIPADAEVFDVSGLVGEPKENPFAKFQRVELPTRGEQKVLARFQLHSQYCGVLKYFAQYTDLYADDNRQIQTPGFEWLILQNGKPVFPYTRLDMIVNPWGYNCIPITIRLDENARVEFVIRNRSVDDNILFPTDPDLDVQPYPIRAFAGRIVGYYWYNEVFGRRI